MKRMTAILMAVVILMGALAIPAGATELTTPGGIPYSGIGQEIESYIQEREGGLAAAAVAVISGDEVIYSNHFGHADRELGVKAGEDTVFEWGSCSKLLVWVSVMQLYERGLLELDVDIRGYLPEGFLKKCSYEDPITMRNLMNHTAGWQETVYDVEVPEEERIVSLEKALQNTEPAQAYRPGEHTAYSNWGAALAAYIVQRVSGMDYRDYVHENILKPLGMAHTSVGSDYLDNPWVREKREELKCYSITLEDEESFGTCISYILLYPAGSATGTLEDFAVFAKAFTASECVLFEKEETRAEMLKATSWYGDSDIAMNCHGLWTTEYAVQTMGHAGNTNGCTSMLQFDPVSGLGIVVMTNEGGETAFNYGLPKLLFGEIKAESVSETKDISGVYIATRGFDQGFLKFLNCIGAGVFMPVSKTENPNEFSIFGMAQMCSVGDGKWIQYDENGLQVFFYDTGNGFEGMCTDYILDPFYWCKIGALVFAVVLAMVSLVLLVVKLIRRKKGWGDKNILLAQGLHTTLGISMVVLVCITRITKGFAMTFCLAEAILAFLFAGNAVYLIQKAWKAKGKGERFGRVLWALFGLFACGFILYFQLYNFWSC